MYLNSDPRIGAGANGRPRPELVPQGAARAWREEFGATTTLEDDFAQRVAQADDLRDVERALAQAAENLTGAGSARLVPLPKRGLTPGFEAAAVAARRGARVWGWLVLDDSIERLGDRRDHVLNRLEALGMIAGRALDQMEMETRSRANPADASPAPNRAANAPGRSDETAIPGVYDETFLNAVLPLFFSQAKRHGEPLSILYAAIDRLEAIRSLLGVDLAELAAEGVGRAIASRIRSSDFAARLADGRFVVALPRADMLGALVVARDLQRIVAETAPAVSEVPGLGISIGAASYPSRASSLAELHQAAESALASARGLRHDQAGGISGPSSARHVRHPAPVPVDLL